MGFTVFCREKADDFEDDDDLGLRLKSELERDIGLFTGFPNRSRDAEGRIMFTGSVEPHLDFFQRQVVAFLVRLNSRHFEFI